MKQKKENIFFGIVSIIGVVAMLFVIFFGSDDMFFTVGAIGGCVFIIKLFLEGVFPNFFKDNHGKRK